MVLFLQILSVACVCALLCAYQAYRHCLRAEPGARDTKKMRLYVAVMLISTVICIAATLILRSLAA